MEMKKVILALATSLFLVGCANPNTHSSVESSNSSASESTTTSQSETETKTETSSETSSEQEQEAYKVNIRNSVSEVTLTADKQKAKEGEKVTITATVSGDSYIISNVFYDGTPCHKENDTTYTFIMPNHAVFITCNLGVVSGDVKLQGGITALFAKEGDMYVARDVKVDKDSEFDLVISNEGHETKMKIINFDRTKTFANIGFTNGSDSIHELKIDGGATYDFYYDPANGDRPCYVVRTKINTLPTSADGLYKLFDGSIGTETSVLPRNLVSTVFKNSLTSETLNWNLYNDNTSLAEVSKINMSGEKVVKSVVYSAIENDKLTVVDTFAPGILNAYAKNNVFVKDKKVFSGEYKISNMNLDNNEKTSDTEFKEYQNFVNPNIAQMMVNTSPVTMEAYESEIMDAYRVGYLVEGDVTQANTKVVSTLNADESFDVKVSSSKTVDSTADRGSTGATSQTHYEYRVGLKFDKAGALLSSTYNSKSFGEGEYDFKRLQFVNGTVEENWENNGNIVKQLSLQNSYGEPGENNKNFDPSPYIVSEIKNVQIVNKDITEHEGNRLNLGDRLEITGDEKTSTVTFDALPATALNKYQYKIISTSDENIIGKVNNYWVARGAGEANVTIGNSNGFGVKSVSKVNVYCTYKLRSVYLFDELGRYPNIINTVKGIVYTTRDNPFRIQVQESGRNKVVPMPLDMSAEFIGDSLGMTVSFDYEAQVMHIDASKSTAKGGEVIKLKIMSSIYDPDWIRDDIIFSFDVKKQISKDALVGTWNITGGGVDTCTFTTEEADTTRSDYKGTRPYKGKLVVGGVTYEFDYGFDNNKNIITADLVDSAYDFSTFDIIYDSDKDTISILFVIKQFVYPPVPDEEILGYEDEGGDSNHYVEFTRAGDSDAA